MDGSRNYFWILLTCFALLSCSKPTKQYRFSCAKCGSFMKSDDSKLTEESAIRVVIMTPTYSNCRHDWQRGGISAVHPNSIPEMALVLVREGGAIGAFMPIVQKMNPESVQYRWWFRDDGETRLDLASNSVNSGTNTFDASAGSASGIEFGPFKIGWSGQQDGRGWLYYDHAHRSAVPADGLLMCVTSVTNLQSFDFSDDAWRFFGAPETR